MAAPAPWTIRDRTFTWGQRTYLMGILNVTPDSFSDGGQFQSLPAAIAQARHLLTHGVDILDIGGQSTRPGALTISEAEELARVVPVVAALRADPDPILRGAVISVDTSRAAVARAAHRAGADIVNDVSAGSEDAAMFSTVADLGMPMVLMHRRGTPVTMQGLTDYADLMGEIHDFLARQIAAAIAVGIDAQAIALDPGLGFAKTSAQNLEILRQLHQLQDLGCPLLVGPSRKSFLGWLLDQPDPQGRIWGTAAACCAAIAGGADMLRVHDGAEMAQVCRVADALWRPQALGEPGR
ncbi:MAG: dihydropteroate synthase [Cyanobacteriota bacterium]|nr:dihydropteroate synthase [Cyanobacteriota bacterium]